MNMIFNKSLLNSSFKYSSKKLIPFMNKPYSLISKNSIKYSKNVLLGSSKLMSQHFRVMSTLS